MLNEDQKKAVFKSLRGYFKQNSRKISRAQFLAFAYIRGYKYRDIEKTTHWDIQDRANGNKEGYIASEVLSYQVCTEILKITVPEFKSIWDPTVHHIYTELKLNLKAWFTESENETVSCG